MESLNRAYNRRTRESCPPGQASPGRASCALTRWRRPAGGTPRTLVQQAEGRLRACVGLREDGGRRLRQDLGPRELRGLVREVGVADRALRRVGVLQRDAQAVHGRTDRELLERAQPAAQLADLLHGLVQ